MKKLYLHIQSKSPVCDECNRHEAKISVVGHAKALIQRAAEAAALRHLVVDELQAHPKRPVVLLGDLNDTTHSVPMEMITGSQPWMSLDEKERKKVWETYLWNASEVCCLYVLTFVDSNKIL